MKDRNLIHRHAIKNMSSQSDIITAGNLNNKNTFYLVFLKFKVLGPPLDPHSQKLWLWVIVIYVSTSPESDCDAA